MIILSAKNKMDKMYLKELGKKIADFRKDNRYSEKEFAEIIGCSRPVLRNMEKGNDANTKFYRYAINHMKKNPKQAIT